MVPPPCLHITPCPLPPPQSVGTRALSFTFRSLCLPCAPWTFPHCLTSGARVSYWSRVFFRVLTVLVLAPSTSLRASACAACVLRALPVQSPLLLLLLRASLGGFAGFRWLAGARFCLCAASANVRRHRGIDLSASSRWWRGRCCCFPGIFLVDTTRGPTPHPDWRGLGACEVAELVKWMNEEFVFRKFESCVPSGKEIFDSSVSVEAKS